VAATAVRSEALAATATMQTLRNQGMGSSFLKLPLRAAVAGAAAAVVVVMGGVAALPAAALAQQQGLHALVQRGPMLTWRSPACQVAVRAAVLPVARARSTDGRGRLWVAACIKEGSLLSTRGIITLEALLAPWQQQWGTLLRTSCKESHMAVKPGHVASLVGIAAPGLALLVVLRHLGAAVPASRPSTLL